MASKPHLVVLVHNRLQQQLIELGCSEYRHIIPSSQFMLHPASPVAADTLYFPYAYSELPRQAEIGVGGGRHAVVFA
jgi:hypothetical protein